MTQPLVIPSKLKTWTALAGSVLAVVIPLLVSVEDMLPAPWPAVIGAVIAALTALGVYKAPYVPTGTVLVPEAQVKSTPAPAQPTTTTELTAGTYSNPWKT